MGQRQPDVQDPEAVARARAVFDAWGSWEEASDASGIAQTTLRRIAKRETWTRRELTEDEQTERRRKLTAAGGARSLQRWAERRASAADECGSDAMVVEQIMVDHVLADRVDEARKLVSVFGVLIDKAQLLSGGSTGRIDVATPEQRRERLQSARDELAARRAS